MQFSLENSDLKPMSTRPTENSSFQKILEEKISSLARENEPSTNSVIGSPLWPLDKEIWVETVHFSSHKPSQREFKSTPYRGLKRSSTQTVPPPKILEPTNSSAPSRAHNVTERSFPVHQLSTAAQLALFVLGLPSDSQSQIKISGVKRAFRRLARECHPDLHPEQPKKSFHDIKDAASLLLNELKSLS